MSLLRNLNPRRDTALRALLERFQSDEAYRALLVETLKKALPTLNDDEQAKLISNPQDLFFPPPPPRPAAPPPPPKLETYKDMKQYVQNRLLAELDPRVDIKTIHNPMNELFQTILDEAKITLSKVERTKLFEAITADILGFGPLEILLRDETISEIWVLGIHHVFVTRNGQRENVKIEFDDENHILRIIDRIVAPIGKRCGESHPIASVRLADGSQVQVILRPLAQQGHSLYIHKFQRRNFSADDLVQSGMITPEAMKILQYAVQAQLNIVIAGGAASGKTTLLNVLAQSIPAEQLICTVEHITELQLSQPQILWLQTRPPNVEGKGEITVHQLAEQAVGFKSDYVVLGGTQGAGLLPLIEAGTPYLLDVTTSHAEGAMQHLRYSLRATQPELPDDMVREMLLSSIDMIVEISRMANGTRRVTGIYEPKPDGRLIPIFEYDTEDIPENDRQLRPTGLRPNWIDRLIAVGLTLPPFVP